MRNESLFPTFTERALVDGHLRMSQSGRTEKVIYVAVDYPARWSDPEEKVRAEFYAELIYRYNYPPNRIGVEVTVPDRSPNDFADLLVFRDDERKRPYAAIECKRDGISDAEFTQAVEQAWGNGNAHKFRAAYVGVVAGNTKKFLDCSDRYGALERDSNVVADLPIDYGKPPEWKYRKGGSKDSQDIKPVSKGDLIAAIKKCHQTLWGVADFHHPPRSASSARSFS
jgi:type I restriction enzyme M protein